MRLCNDTITVCNKRVSDGAYVYVPSVINGVSWYGSVDTKVGDKGLVAANRYTVRIPVDADFGGKTYLDPVEYQEAEDVSDAFTLASGDIIIKAAIEENMTPAMLKETHYDFCTVLGVTDDRRAPNAPHWKVVGG